MEFVWVFFGLILIFGFVVFWGAPYVPTKRHDLADAFDELYRLSASDVCVDLGSGDGLVLREAARRGARAIGYELNPLLAFLSMILGRRYKTIGVRCANYWQVMLPHETTVVYVFSDTRDMPKLMKYMQRQANNVAHPIALISYAFKFSDQKPDKTIGMHHLYTFYPLQHA